VNIKIIDDSGNSIRKLVDAYQSYGFYCISWNGKYENDEIVDDGLYRVLFYADSIFCHGDIRFIPFFIIM
jgi:flagellar hook assembly protein FlgD